MCAGMRFQPLVSRHKGLGVSCWKKRAHLLLVQEIRRISSLDFQGPLQETLGTEMLQAVVRATLGVKSSVFSLERWRSRVPETVARAAAFQSLASQEASPRGRLLLSLASTFLPAQYNPGAAPQRRGLGADNRGMGGTRWFR
ncbi:hypothetical protein HJG60_010896 [Phyllostomus discolor]|uniref:Uncharacterized protein n=1 Tax=Phyllostomus discolor TaxID=89673 RepID=A0A834A734_9CHIR|nr:hypothetical protein HJG60_010896 [Phyllostomus discolor]